MTIPKDRLLAAVEEFAETDGKEETRMDHPAIFEAMEDRADFAAELLVLQPWAEKAREVLEDVEWSSSPGSTTTWCRICGGDQRKGHREDCAIAELLKTENDDPAQP